MNMWTKCSFAILCVAVLLSTANIASAQTQQARDTATEADHRFQLGLRAQRGGDLNSALEHYLASNRLVPNRGVIFNIAQCYEGLGNNGLAFRFFDRFLSSEGRASEQAVAQAQTSLNRIRPRLALAEITSEPAGAAVFVDRRDLGSVGETPLLIPLTAGSHTIILERPGFEAVTLENVTVTVGSTETASAELTQILGQVEVTSTPSGADIRVSSVSDLGDLGRLVGRTPAVINVAPGTQALRIMQPGYESRRVEVTVRQNETTRVPVTLEPLLGNIVIEADERDAIVELDGRAVGVAPTVLQRIEAGTHNVRISRRGFESYETEIEVRPDEDANVSASLSPSTEVEAATREAQRADDAPASVSILTQDEIRVFAYRNVADALSSVRGFYPTDDLVYEHLGSRGFLEAAGYNNRLLLLQETFPVNEVVTNASFVDFMGHHYGLQDVERIEVIRGPGSTTYGSNAFFGVVNLQTRDQDGDLSPTFTLSSDFFGQGRAHASAGHRFGENSGFWISGSGVVSQPRDIVFDEAGVTALDADGLSGGIFQARIWHDDLQIQMSYRRTRKGVNVGIFGADFNPPQTQFFTESGAFIDALYSPKVSDNLDLQFRLSGSYGGYDSLFIFEGAEVEDDYDGILILAEARSVWRPTSWLRLTTGFQGGLLPLMTISLDEDGAPLAREEEGDNFRLAPYVETEIKLAEVLTITAGVRYDYFSSIEEGAFSPRLAFVLRPYEQGTVKLLGGGAFRVPSAYERLYNDDFFQSKPAGNFGPERLWSAEMEFTHRFNDSLFFQTSVFYNALFNLVTTEPSPELTEDGAFRFTNSDDVIQVFGVETELRREFRQGWMLDVIYSFQRARAGSPFGSNEITDSPEHLFGGRVAVPVGDSTHLAFRLRAEAARLVESFVTEEFDRADVPVLLDVTVSGKIEEINGRYAFGLRNALDWRYNLPGGADSAQTFLPQRGREFFFDFQIAYQ